MQSGVTTIVDWIIGGIGAALLIRVLAEIVGGYKAESQKRIITSIAVFNGLILELGLSPMGTFASQLVPLSPLLTVEFSNLIRSLITVGTALEILYGLGKMWEGSGGFGISAFILAFLGGAMIPYQDTMVVGTFLIVLAIPLMEIAPANQWRTRSW